MKEHLQQKKMLELMSKVQVKDDSITTATNLYSIYKHNEKDKNILFVENFTKAGGKLTYCFNDADFRAKLTTLIEYKNWQSIACYSRSLFDFLNLDENRISLFEDTENREIGLNLCQNLIARTGSVVITSSQGLGKKFAQLPKTILIAAFTSQVVTDMQKAYEQIYVQNENTLPEAVLTLTTSEMLNNEIDDFYVFLIEDIEIDY